MKHPKLEWALSIGDQTWI